MLTVTGLWFDHERTPVGLDHTPVFGWQLEGNCRNIRQTQYRLQVALTPDFAALLYDETCETGNSTAVHAAGLTLQSLQKYYARVQVWADTAAGPQQTLWSEPAVFITALLDPAAEWKAEFVSAESPETCRESSAGTMVRAAFTVKPGLRAAYACTTALGLYNVYLNGQKVSTDEMTPGWTSYNRRLLYQTYEVTAMLHPGLNMAGAMLGAGWYKGVMGLTRSRNNYGDTTAFAMQIFPTLLIVRIPTCSEYLRGRSFSSSIWSKRASTIVRVSAFRITLQERSSACCTSVGSPRIMPASTSDLQNTIMRSQLVLPS